MLLNPFCITSANILQKDFLDELQTGKKLTPVAQKALQIKKSEHKRMKIVLADI